MIIKHHLILLLILTVVLTACSSQQKPENVRQEIWDESKEYFLKIHQKLQKHERLTNKDTEDLIYLYEKYKKLNLTESEKKLLDDINLWLQTRLIIDMSNMLGKIDVEQKAMENYVESYENLKIVFGVKEVD